MTEAMTRAYIRIDPALPERKADYPDGPFRAYIETLCLAEYQPERGRFRNVRVLKALLDRAGKHVDYLLEHDDLTVTPDGRVYVVGWDEWQEGDVTVRERQQRIRNRRRGHAHRNPGSNADSNGPRNASDREQTVYDVYTLKTFSASGSKDAAPLRAAPLDDERHGELLGELASSLAPGILPDRPNGRPREETPEDIVARCRAIIDDPEAEPWRIEAARAQLGLMGETA